MILFLIIDNCTSKFAVLCSTVLYTDFVSRGKENNEKTSAGSRATTQASGYEGAF